MYQFVEFMNVTHVLLDEKSLNVDLFMDQLN